MKKSFKNYPEYFFIDYTYCIDYFNSALFIIVILDNNRNMQIAAFGFV